METKILHVEDNADDVLLVKMAFRKAGVAATLQVASDGDKAIQALSDCTPTNLPVCVLLDIKLPSQSGLEVLTWIRSNTATKRLPVIMLTSSLLAGDVNQAYDAGANSYLIKPPSLESLIELAKIIDSYWLRTNTRPNLMV
jgi:CheY-like chemotaxis protein